MNRKRHYKQPIVEKFVTNPLHDFKPGLFIPTFRLYGLDKATDEATITCYNETEYVERKASNHNKTEFKMGCEIRLSECTPKAVNIRHQSQRRLNNTITDIMKQRHLTLKETDIEKQRIQHENTMKVKRVTVPLKDLKIPGWRYTDNVCRCKNCDGSQCPVHWDKVDQKKSLPRPPSIRSQRSFIVDTISDDEDDYTFFSSRKPKEYNDRTRPKTSTMSSVDKKSVRPKTSRGRIVSFKT